MTILLKTIGVKKFSKKVKIALDKSLFFDTLIFVDKCVPVKPGRFAF
jgi:hypothetical protein